MNIKFLGYNDLFCGKKDCTVCKNNECYYAYDSTLKLTTVDETNFSVWNVELYKYLINLIIFIYNFKRNQTLSK